MWKDVRGKRQPTARQLNEVAKRAEEHLSGGRGTQVSRSFGGLMLGSNQPEVLHARISGTATSSGDYAWQEVYYDMGTGAWADYPAGRSGTTSSLPAREANGSTGIADGTRVQLRLDESRDFYHILSGGMTVVNGDLIINNVTNLTFLTQYFFVYESSPGTVVILPLDFSRYERYWKTTYENSIDGAWYFGGEPERAGDVTLASTAANADLLYAMPILEAKGRKIRNIAFWLTSANAGGAVRIGIYTNSSTDYPYPDTLVYDSGELSADTTPDDEGLRQVSPCYQTQPGSLYWLAFLCDFTSTPITIKTVDSAECWCVIGNDDTWTTNDAGCGWAVTQTYGALPDPFPEDAEPVTGGQLPAIGVQYGDCDSSEGGDGTLDLEELTLEGTGTYTGPPPITVTGCCIPAYDVPVVLDCDVTETADCSSLTSASFQLTYNSGTSKWEGTGTLGGLGGRQITVKVYCDGGTNSWTYDVSFSDGCHPGLTGGVAGVFTCNPLSFSFARTVSSGACGCDVGTPVFGIVVTEP